MRELRQNLSVYLRRVEAGETLRVTDRGRPVAVLAPLPRTTSRYDELLAQGLITPATGSIQDLPPPPPLPDDGGPTLSQVLQEMRDDERY